MSNGMKLPVILVAFGLFACSNDNNEATAVDPQGSDLVTSSTDDGLAAEQADALEFEYPVYELDGAVAKFDVD